MDSKFFVSLEAEELLKEKGYPFVWGYDSIHPRKVTKAEAIDWLEGKNLTITIDWIRFNEQRRWCYGICNNETCDWEGSRYEYITRLEAEDAAIIKALELL